MTEPEELTPPLRLDVQDALTLLAAGELSIEGRLVDASNATLYCGITLDGVSAACVYKPVMGERPLWDFPDGTLAGREVAAYAVSAATGWTIVPPTLLREGPVGIGMVQLWAEPDDTIDLARFVRSRSNRELRRIAVFDAVINNADRKGGHILPLDTGHVHGIDHGISFHNEEKLRTILWQWAGQGLDDESIDMLSQLRSLLEGDLAETLAEHLTGREVRKTIKRVDRLLMTGLHPEPSDERRAVPWPPF
jgi:uncharacterized repeat protein (TIGR03843 family)